MYIHPILNTFSKIEFPFIMALCAAEKELFRQIFQHFTENSCHRMFERKRSLSRATASNT